tara:strand:+ start:1722 stop:3026 length:1305 start_codon:yes stop_codon:yes gene_type:complete
MKKFLFLSLFISVNVWATDLIDLHSRALQHNIDLIHDRLNLNIADEDLKQKRSSVYPEINFTAQASETTIERYKSTGAYNPSDYDRDTYSLTIKQPIFHLYVFDEIRKSQESLLKNNITSNDSESLIILESARHYFNLIKYKNLVELNQIKKNYYNVKYNSSLKLLDSGNISIQEHEKHKNDFDKSIIDVQLSKNELAAIKNQVYIFSGKELNDINDIKLIDIEHRNFTEDELINLVYLRNNSIKISKQNIKISRNDIASQKSRHYPTLDILAEYGYSDITQGGSQFGPTTREDSTISLVLNFPIFNGGYQNSKTRQAQLNYQKARYDYKNTKRIIKSEMIDTLNEYNVNKDKFKVSLQVQKSKQKKFENAQIGYEKGIYSDTDLLNAEIEYFESKFNSKNIMMDYIYNKLMLDYLSNNLDIKSLRKINTYLVW